MGLVDLWLSSPEQLQEKHVKQVMAFAGSGKLLDGSEASEDFRAFLDQIPSSLLQRYAGECLTDSFPDSGLPLQDIVNQVGKRLGFQVTDGRYRGTQASIGFDGIWELHNEHSFVVEVKTTDAFRIKLGTVMGYRRALLERGSLPSGSSSVLIVVGRQDTGDLEAQIRGSRHAWDVRLISVEALLRLMTLKESVEDPTIVRRIHSILMPREFTRLDEIVEVLFSTAEDIKQEDEALATGEPEASKRAPKFTPVAFHDACVARIQAHLGRTLLKRSRATFSSADESVRLICAVSREHGTASDARYWFAFHPHQKEYLEASQDAYVGFGCGSEDRIVLVPFADFGKWLAGMNTTTKGDKTYWHVHIDRSGSKYVLRRKSGQRKIDLTPYYLANDA